MVPTTTVAPEARGAEDTGTETDTEGAVVGVWLGGPPPPGAGTTGDAVGQLLTDGCVVYEAHPIVVVPDIIIGRSGTGVSLQSIVTINTACAQEIMATYYNSHNCKLHLVPNRWRPHMHNPISRQY